MTDILLAALKRAKFRSVDSFPVKDGTWLVAFYGAWRLRFIVRESITCELQVGAQEPWRAEGLTLAEAELITRAFGVLIGREGHV